MKWYENEKKLKERWKRDILKRTTVKYEAKEKERQNMRNRTLRKIHQEKKRTKILKIKQQKFQRILNYV